MGQGSNGGSFREMRNIFFWGSEVRLIVSPRDHGAPGHFATKRSTRRYASPEHLLSHGLQTLRVHCKCSKEHLTRRAVRSPSPPSALLSATMWFTAQTLSDTSPSQLLSRDM